MKINILRSSFQTDAFVWNEYADLIERLKKECQAEITVIGDGATLPQTAPDAVMIATGGVENLFKTLFTGHGPVTLIADGRNNSLAAALEILTWLEGQGVEGKILHGTNEEIMKGLMGQMSGLGKARIGLFGKPSDWLIASGVDREYLLEHFGVETLDIDLQRLIDGVKAVSKEEAAKVAQVKADAKYFIPLQDLQGL